MSDPKIGPAALHATIEEIASCVSEESALAIIDERRAIGALKASISHTLAEQFQLFWTGNKLDEKLAAIDNLKIADNVGTDRVAPTNKDLVNFEMRKQLIEKKNELDAQIRSLQVESKRLQAELAPKFRLIDEQTHRITTHLH